MEQQKRVIALGFFDGVHLGHGALLRRVAERAAELEAVPTAYTFDQSPSAALTGREVPLLTDVSSRILLMNELYGIQQVVVAPFARMRDMDWRVFIADYLKNELGVVHVVAGHDFRFGRKGEGNPDRLRAECARLGMGCDIIPRVERDGVTVSSTYIRSLIAQGDMERANAFLGHPYSLTAAVGHGKHLGTALGFPTVNLTFPAGVMVPAFGVYAARVWVLPDDPGHDACLPAEGPYPAAANVGVRPTVEDGSQVTAEGFLLDFNGDLYGRTLRMDFFSRLREERKFPSLEALRAEVMRNADQARAYFESQKLRRL